MERRLESTQMRDWTGNSENAEVVCFRGPQEEDMPDKSFNAQQIERGTILGRLFAAIDSFQALAFEDADVPLHVTAAVLTKCRGKLKQLSVRLKGCEAKVLGERSDLQAGLMNQSSMEDISFGNLTLPVFRVLCSAVPSMSALTSVSLYGANDSEGQGPLVQVSPQDAEAFRSALVMPALLTLHLLNIALQDTG